MDLNNTKVGSFTDWVKDEILNNLKTIDEKKIMMFSLFLLNGFEKEDKYIVKSINKNLKEKFLGIISEYICNDYFVHENQKSFSVEFKKSFVEGFINKDISYENLDLNQKKSVLVGVFIAGGWINSPTSKFYHLEIRIKDDHILDIVKKILDEFDISYKQIVKNNKNEIYIKKSSLISDFLKLINSIESLLYYEDERIVRDMISNMKKIEAIESHNYSKTINSSKNQILAYNIIKKNHKIKILTTNQQKIIKLRIENKDLSLNDLTYLFNKINETNFSKSTINSWLKKIVKISNDIKGEKIQNNSK